MGNSNMLVEIKEPPYFDHLRLEDITVLADSHEWVRFSGYFKIPTIQEALQDLAPRE